VSLGQIGNPYRGMMQLLGGANFASPLPQLEGLADIRARVVQHTGYADCCEIVICLEILSDLNSTIGYETDLVCRRHPLSVPFSCACAAAAYGWNRRFPKTDVIIAPVSFPLAHYSQMRSRLTDWPTRQNPIGTRVKRASKKLGATIEQSTEPVDKVVDNRSAPSPNIACILSFCNMPKNWADRNGLERLDFEGPWLMRLSTLGFERRFRWLRNRGVYL